MWVLAACKEGNGDFAMKKRKDLLEAQLTSPLYFSKKANRWMRQVLSSRKFHFEKL